MNVRDLHEELRTHFTCIDGVPRNYMEIRIQVPRPEPPHEPFIHHARLIYQSVGITMRGEPDQIEPILCAWFWQRMLGAFQQEEIEDRSVLLLWRRWPSVESYIDQSGREATKLRARFTIPTDDLKRVFGEGYEEDGNLGLIYAL